MIPAFLPPLSVFKQRFQSRLGLLLLTQRSQAEAIQKAQAIKVFSSLSILGITVNHFAFGPKLLLDRPQGFEHSRAVKPLCHIGASRPPRHQALSNRPRKYNSDALPTNNASRSSHGSCHARAPSAPPMSARYVYACRVLPPDLAQPAGHFRLGILL